MKTTTLTRSEAKDRGMAAALGCTGGIAGAAALTAAAGGDFLGSVPSWMLVASAVPLGVIASLTLLAENRPSLPVREALRYIVLLLPILFMAEFLIGGIEAFGPFQAVATAASAGLVYGRLSMTSLFGDTDTTASTDGNRHVDWNRRFEVARERLAQTSVTVSHRRSRHEREIEAFERKLRDACVEAREEADVVLDVPRPLNDVRTESVAEERRVRAA